MSGADTGAVSKKKKQRENKKKRAQLKALMPLEAFKETDPAPPKTERVAYAAWLARKSANKEGADVATAPVMYGVPIMLRFVDSGKLFGAWMDGQKAGAMHTTLTESAILRFHRRGPANRPYSGDVDQHVRYGDRVNVCMTIVNNDDGKVERRHLDCEPQANGAVRKPLPVRARWFDPEGAWQEFRIDRGRVGDEVHIGDRISLASTAAHSANGQPVHVHQNPKDASRACEAMWHDPEGQWQTMHVLTPAMTANELRLAPPTARRTPRLSRNSSRNSE